MGSGHPIAVVPVIVGLRNIRGSQDRPRVREEKTRRARFYILLFNHAYLLAHSMRLIMFEFAVRHQSR